MTYDFTREGFVYFAKCPWVDLVKIGFSERPQVRVRELRFRDRYGRCRLLGAIAGTGWDERQMHVRFAAARRRIPDGTEFFQYSLIRDEIAALLPKPRRKAAK